MNDQLLVKSVRTSKSFDWVKWLESEELVEFFTELFKLLTHISDGKKDVETLFIFLSEWRETALINSEPEVLAALHYNKPPKRYQFPVQNFEIHRTEVYHSDFPYR